MNPIARRCDDTGVEMEDPTMTEFFFEVTRMEDMANLVEGGAPQELAKLGDAAQGFRQLAANPEHYGVAGEDLRTWSQVLDPKLDALQSLIRAPDGRSGLVAGELIEDVQTRLSDRQREAFPKGLF